jgi:transcription elongation factor Elf1
MQSYLMAVYDFIMAIMHDGSTTAKIERNVETPAGYKPFYFNCWLCKGYNKFACKISSAKKAFIIECSWCGMDNNVTLPGEKE